MIRQKGKLFERNLGKLSEALQLAGADYSRPFRHEDIHRETCGNLNSNLPILNFQGFLRTSDFLMTAKITVLRKFRFFGNFSRWLIFNSTMYPVSSRLLDKFEESKVID